MSADDIKFKKRGMLLYLLDSKIKSLKTNPIKYKKIKFIEFTIMWCFKEFCNKKGAAFVIADWKKSTDVSEDKEIFSQRLKNLEATYLIMEDFFNEDPKWKNEIPKNLAVKRITEDLKFYYEVRHQTNQLFEPEFFIPTWTDFSFHELNFWIINTKILEKKKQKHSNHFFSYIQELHKMNENEYINDILVNIYKKLFKHVKYGKGGKIS